eukprot:g7297.t1
MATVVISPLLFVIGTVFIIYMVGNAVAVTHQCEELLGKSLWEVATPRQVFHDGLFEPPECHFHTITAIEAPGKDITHLTPAIGDLVSLQTLDLRDNRIIHLPIEISKLKMDVLRDVKLDGNPVFTSLDWSNKGINTFPKILHEHFRGLKYLDLSNNKLQRLPSQVSLLDDLETLDLRNNTISRDGLPHSLYLMQRLHKRRGLSVTNNPVHTQLTLHGVKADDSAICIEFVKTYFAESMVDLDVSKSELEAGDFHSILESMDALTSLNISHNRIKSLFSLQKSGNRLDMLDLSGNPIADIRLLFFQLDLRYNYKLRGSLNFTTNLKSLVILELTHNNFTGRLPNGISNLKPLSRLILGGNDLEGEVPNGVTRLTCLTQLHLGGNRLHGKIDFITVLTRVKRLNLETNAFTGTVPSKISNLEDLLSLKLGKNKLHGNLNFITNLKSLQTLELGYNNFTGKLPNGISKLTRLSSLRLRVNNLAGEVPQKLTRLTKMTQLHVGGNRFHGGIAFITALTRMQYLNLQANAFTGPVPSKISSFRYLTNLRLGRNNFTGELPFGISSLTKLTTLSVEKNPLLVGNITRITSSLSKLDYLNITMTSMLT